MHEDLASRCGGLGRWRRTLCAKRQECQAALAPATRGHCEESAACAPGVSPPRPRPGLGLRAQAGREPRLSAVPRPPGALRARPRGPGSQTASVGLEEEDRRRKGPLSSITPRALRSPGLITVDVELDHLADVLSVESVRFLHRQGVLSPLPDAALGGRKPHEQPAGRVQRTPAPGGGGPQPEAQGSGAGGVSTFTGSLIRSPVYTTMD